MQLRGELLGRAEPGLPGILSTPTYFPLISPSFLGGDRAYDGASWVPLGTVNDLADQVFDPSIALDADDRICVAYRQTLRSSPPDAARVRCRGDQGWAA